MRTNPQNVLKAQYKQTYSTKLTLLQNDDNKKKKNPKYNMQETLWKGFIHEMGFERFLELSERCAIDCMNR